MTQTLTRPRLALLLAAISFYWYVFLYLWWQWPPNQQPLYFIIALSFSLGILVWLLWRPWHEPSNVALSRFCSATGFMTFIYLFSKLSVGDLEGTSISLAGFLIFLFALQYFLTLRYLLIYFAALKGSSHNELVPKRTLILLALFLMSFLSNALYPFQIRMIEDSAYYPWLKRVLPFVPLVLPLVVYKLGRSLFSKRPIYKVQDNPDDSTGR